MSVSFSDNSSVPPDSSPLLLLCSVRGKERAPSLDLSVITAIHLFKSGINLSFQHNIHLLRRLLNFTPSFEQNFKFLVNFWFY